MFCCHASPRPCRVAALTRRGRRQGGAPTCAMQGVRAPSGSASPRLLSQKPQTLGRCWRERSLRELRSAKCRFPAENRGGAVAPRSSARASPGRLATARSQSPRGQLVRMKSARGQGEPGDASTTVFEAEQRTSSGGTSPAPPREISWASASTSAPTSILDDPACVVAGLAAFGLIALDVFGPFSAHLFQPIDQSVHQWVLMHTPASLRADVMDKAISELSIAIAYIGISGCLCLGALVSPEASLRQGAVTLVALMEGGGLVRHSDPALVHALKETFHRDRPSTLHHTFSFPSGHTTAAWLALGAFLCYLLPSLMREMDQKAAEACKGADPADQGPLSAAVASMQAQVLAAYLERREALVRVQSWSLALWASLGALTAAGRVLADVHWVSDTAAGAVLGFTLVCTMRQVDRVARNLWDRAPQ